MGREAVYRRAGPYSSFCMEFCLLVEVFVVYLVEDIVGTLKFRVLLSLFNLLVVNTREFNRVYIHFIYFI